ncbi:hypothetical protein HDJGFE_01545 [Metamycoplasma hominis]|uniref:hypothetical protein n=1 Tax=Metamycoplasma hominis TaxID=2098 RepID=UPI002735871D|nr:hypothetical protein [Metamycoplasma hominis]
MIEKKQDLYDLAFFPYLGLTPHFSTLPKLSAKNLEIEEYLSSEKTFENYRIYNPSLWMNDLNWKIKEQEKILNDINSKISSIKESSFTNKEFKNTFVELKQKLSILNKN